MTSRQKSASNCPGKCRHPTSVHPDFYRGNGMLLHKNRRFATETSLAGFARRNLPRSALPHGKSTPLHSGAAAWKAACPTAPGDRGRSRSPDFRSGPEFLSYRELVLGSLRHQEHVEALRPLLARTQECRAHRRKEQSRPELPATASV